MLKTSDPIVLKKLEDAWLNLPEDFDENKIFNPMLELPDGLEDNHHLYFIWLMSQPEYFCLFVKEVLNIEIIPTQCVVLEEFWYRKFPMIICSRGFSKTFLLALYTFLRLLFIPKRKVVICGAGFRQSKLVFEYMETIWNNSPILRDICGQYGGPSKDPDLWRFRIFDSVALFCPIGDGQKIRGLRANDIFVDEFASINPDIFEQVISGFGAVSSSPVENIKNRAKEKLAKTLDVWEEHSIDNKLAPMPNQIIISGTAYYDFNHFSRYWKQWHKIIESHGNKDLMITALGGEDKYDESLKHTDYSIFRVPFELIPKGFMDDAQVARAKATFDKGIYEMEYGSTFSKDSNGFFRRSLVQTCSVSPETDFRTMPADCELFYATLHGKPGVKYVYGIDPASERDNFSIIIIEVHNTHRRIVYCWTTNKKDFQARLKNNVIKENDYYGYCALKIRELMRRFPTEDIAMDSQGGGYAILEALHNDKYIDTEKQELPLWPKINYDKPSPYDNEHGLHIVDMINFSSADWCRDANHGLRADFENKVLLFPFYDSISIGEVQLIEDEKRDGIKYDSLEDCIIDIEELKDELATIIVTQTTNGRERWDTPEIKLSGQKKGRARKDRYSALLMANMVARTVKPVVQIRGTHFDNSAYQNKSMYSGPS